jgi:hypothetical protein
MFRALYGHSRTQEGFSDRNKRSAFLENQTTLFTQRAPDMFLTNAPLENDGKILSALGTTDSITKNLIDGSDVLNLPTRAVAAAPSKDLTDKIAFCEQSTLDELLIQGRNPLIGKYRCGWIYNPEKGISKGALGSSDGPALNNDKGLGRWFWNIGEAKMIIEGDRCAQLIACPNLGAYPNCAYDTARGTGIPVSRTGQPLYSDNAKYGPVGQLITSAGSCPKPTPEQLTIQEVIQGSTKSRDICIPGPDGKFSRECFLNTLTTAGCSTDGSLYKAIATSVGQTYLGNLPEKDSWKRYQRSQTPFPEQQLQSGLMNENYALTSFEALKKATTVSDRSGAGFAARDLCLNSGIYDTFDFCTELNDASRSPFALECLQKEFRRLGGQPAGSAYPTAANKATEWDALRTWREVKNKIEEIIVQSKNTDRAIQRKGLTALLGIQPEADREQIGAINGVEVMWFNRGNNSFIGRRLVTDKLAGFPNFITSGIIDNTGLATNVEFFAVTNMRPSQTKDVKLRVSSDDGFVYLLNSRTDPRAYGRSVDNSNAFGLQRDMGVTIVDANQCWKLQKGGPNYIVGFWYNNNGPGGHKFEISECKGNASYNNVAPNELFLTQEPDAPMFSWEGLKTGLNTLDFNERRFPDMMNLIKSANTSVVAVAPNQNFPFPAALQLRNGLGSSAAATSRFISAQGWRSLSMFFIPSAAILPAQLIKFGPFAFIYAGSNGGFFWESGTLNVKEYLMNRAIVADGSTPHYLHLCMRSDTRGTFPNRILFACGPVSKWKSGEINLPSGSGENVATFTTFGGASVFTTQNATDQLILGDLASVLSANARIGAVRLFDYELSQEDILRDINNAWEMKFLT